MSDIERLDYILTTSGTYYQYISIYTAQKIKFSIKNFFSKFDRIRNVADFTFTEEIYNEKIHFLCSVMV